MDPSMSVSNDPHHPTSFTAFTPFTNSNAYAAPTPNHPFFGGAGNSSAVAPTNNNHLFNASPPPQTPPVLSQTSFTHPPYTEMICTAIAALNEPDGSSKQAISRYIERIYTGIPPAHGSLLTHHLKSLKNSGTLMLVKKSYKFAASSPLPPTNVAVEAKPEPLASSTPQTQKRGRGRPPKPKPDAQQLTVFQSNGKPTMEQNESPFSRPEETQPQPQPYPQTQPQPQIQTETQPQPPFRRPPGRPRKDGASPTVKASSSGDVETVKRRGRPPTGRAAGRERKPSVVSAPASVFPYVANGGVRRRGRPKRYESGASSVVPPPLPTNTESGGDELAVVVAKRRGRGRPPKIGGVIRNHMKPFRGYIRTGKPVGRPRKYPRGASGQQDAGYGELKKKFEFFQEKAKDIVNVLKAEIGGSENQAVVQAIYALEELTVTTNVTTEEPEHMEEVQPEEEHRETEPEPEPEGHGHALTEAEAMQEALF